MKRIGTSAVFVAFTDALTNRASQIITSRRKRSWCGSGADHRHRCSERPSARLYRRPAVVGIRVCVIVRVSRVISGRIITAVVRVTYGPCAHPPRKAVTRPAHRIDRNTGVRRWISSWFSSDIRFLHFPHFVTKPPSRLRLACCSVRKDVSNQQAFLYDSESEGSIGRRPGESARRFGLRRNIDVLQSILHQ